MKPGGQRWLIQPGMVQTHLVGDLVLNDLEPPSMGLGHKLSQGLQAAEVVLNSIMVHRVIAVVVSIRAPRLITFIHSVEVIIPWSEP